MPLRNGSIQHHAWQYARTSASLSGRSKIVLEPDDVSLQLCEELPVGNGTDISKSCEEAVTSLTLADTKLHESEEVTHNHSQKSAPTSTPLNRSFLGSPAPEAGSGSRSSRDAAPALGNSSNSLQDACKEAGWSFTERDNGCLMINLDILRSNYRASLEILPDQGIRVGVQVARYRSLSDITRYALAVFVLTANGVIRFARGGIDETKKGASAFFEVRFFELPSAVEINHAMSALCAACAYCGRELQSLGDDRVARWFLSMRGGPPRI